MKKPTVYVDTNILSFLHYRGADPVALAWRQATREWWDAERPFFKVFASRTVEVELEVGEYAAKQKALAEVCRLPYLPYSTAVDQFADRLLAKGIIPQSKRDDAIQLAFAIVHRVDYLLSWNRAHLVNEQTQARLAHFGAANGLRLPLLVSPYTIPQAALGQAIRRRD